VREREGKGHEKKVGCGESIQEMKGMMTDMAM
jgi:hypothetical protein